MPPLRFKAVCTETGREYHLPDLYLSYTPSIGGKGGLCWGLFHEEIDGFKFEAMPEVCQSTGLTDSRGVEVFEGDVLCDLDGSLFAVIWSEKKAAWAIEYLSEDWEKSCQPLLSDALTINQEQVIGNKWQPAAELKARAEAVSNGQV